MGGNQLCVKSLCSPLLFLGLFSKRVRLSCFSRTTKHFSLITMEVSSLPFSRQVKRKKVSNKQPCPKTLMTTCRRRHYSDNVAKKGRKRRREKGRGNLSELPKAIKVGTGGQGGS